MTSKAVEALRANRAAESARKRRAVRQALAEALHAAEPLTMSGLAEAAGVSRQFIYSHADLRDAVQQAAARRSSEGQRPDATTASADHGLRATLGLLTAKVERQRLTITELRREIEDLEGQRRRWLGSQLETHTAASAEEVAELRVTCDRLVAENKTLEASVEDLTRANRLLASQLAASREAHAQDVATVDIARARASRTGKDG